MPKILLSGCSGHMGNMIAECISLFPNLEIMAGVDIQECSCSFPVYKNFDNVTFPADVLVDFTHPSLLPDILKYCEKYNVPVVLATTGYSVSDNTAIKRASEKLPIFNTPNMSMGISLICEMLNRMSSILYKSFDIEIIEQHHNRKLDAPSGTSILLADSIKNSINSPIEYTYDRHLARKKRVKNEIGIHSIRGGTIVGEHEVIFAGEDEVIKISHSAYSRKVFAVGALRAAEFMAGKAPGFYTMKELLQVTEL